MEFGNEQEAPKSIDEYIEGFPKEVQLRLQKMRSTIRKAVPEAVETISYSMPEFKLDGILVWFAGFKNHIGFYSGASGTAALKKELGDTNRPRAPCISRSASPPLALVTWIVKYRARERNGLVRIRTGSR